MRQLFGIVASLMILAGIVGFLQSLGEEMTTLQAGWWQRFLDALEFLRSGSRQH